MCIFVFLNILVVLVGLQIDTSDRLKTYWQTGWLVGWLANVLADRLAGWLTCSLDGLLAGLLPGCSWPVASLAC